MKLSIEKLRWYGNRVRAMSPAEVLHRIQEVRRRSGGKKHGGWHEFSIGIGPLPALPIDLDRFAEIAAAVCKNWEALWQQAKTGKWEFLGQTWPAGDALSTHMYWHRDPVSNECWPTTQYCFEIPYRHAKHLGDVKYVWELNRLQFLPPLAALARYKDNEEIRQWCIACLEGWILANPPFTGVNWASGIELATRAVSVVLTIALLGEASIPKEAAAKLSALLRAHAFWLDRYPSLYSSANNHLISEAAGLYMLGSLMPQLPEAARYREYGKRTLIAEADKQIFDDGVGAEQSPTYTAFTLEWYALAVSVASATNDRFPAIVADRLRCAAEFLLWITDKSGKHPRFGDDDEGRVILSGKPSQDPYVSSLISVLSGNRDEAPFLRPHLRDIFALKVDGSQGALPAAAMRTFSSGGYTVFRGVSRGRRLQLLFDHGPLGYLSIAAHGHADALAVWLHVDDLPIFVDAGTYLYHSGGSERDYFRGTKAHNTLTLDDENQSEVSGAFNWATKANAWVEISGDRSVTGLHDGYRDRFGILHRRRIEWNDEEGSFTVSDGLSGYLSRPAAVATIRYLLSPEMACRSLGENGFELTASNGSIFPVRILFEDADLACRIEDAAISSNFGAKQVTKRIVVESLAKDLLVKPLVTTIHYAAQTI